MKQKDTTFITQLLSDSDVSGPSDDEFFVTSVHSNPIQSVTDCIPSTHHNHDRIHDSNTFYYDFSMKHVKNSTRVGWGQLRCRMLPTTTVFTLFLLSYVAQVNINIIHQSH